MARPISDEELQLKKRARRRLVGAIVLVSVVAVVLPMVLDSEPKRTGQSVDIQIPSPDSGEFKPQAGAPGSSSAKAVPEAPPKAEPVKPETTAKAEAAKSDPSPKPDVVAKAETPAPMKAEPLASDRATPAATEASQGSPKAAADKPKDAASKSAKSTASAKSANGAYVVQVAALADPNKAKDLEKRMASAGVKTYTEVITTQAGEVTRVRAGPYATRDAAEKARAQLKKAGLEGKIVPK